MPRARAVILTIGISAGSLGAALIPAVAGATGAPPTSPPGVTTTVPGAVAAPSTSVVVAAGTRGGATEGSIAKPRRDTWSPRRIATMTALAVVALAAAGYAYGKLRSAPPRHPDLVHRPPDLDDADRVDATG